MPENSLSRLPLQSTFVRALHKLKLIFLNVYFELLQKIVQVAMNDCKTLQQGCMTFMMSRA